MKDDLELAIDELSQLKEKCDSSSVVAITQAISELEDYKQQVNESEFVYSPPPNQPTK